MGVDRLGALLEVSYEANVCVVSFDFMKVIVVFFFFFLVNGDCRDLQVPRLSMEGLLLKYTRRAQPRADSQPVFSAR